MNFGLDKETIEKFHSVFKRYPEIEKVVIYGSRAKGSHRDGSDIDITLIGRDVTENLQTKVWLDLDELNTPYLIDISVFHLIASESLVEHINRVGKEFYPGSND